MSEETFKEQHIRSLYRLLRHKGFTSRVGSLDYTTKKYEETYIQGEEKIIEYARSYNTKRNVFIGRAYRDSNGTPLGTNVVSFDIDPIRPKEHASTDEQHKNALDSGRRILGRYPGGYLASSGNGALLLYRVSIHIDALEDHYKKEKILIKELQELVGDLNVKIDATNYTQAVVKVIGTFSTKGDSSLRRCSRFISLPIPPYTNCAKLLQRFSEINVEKSLVNPSINVKHILSTYKGDRSQADFHLVNYLHRSGVGPEIALATLQANPLGRQTDEKDQARLISKIYKSTELIPKDKGTYFDSLFTKNNDIGNFITTGINRLDEALGMLPKGEITTLAARSGYGKSSFACTISEYLRKRGKKVLYFSTEMQLTYIMHKFVAIVCGISLANTIKKVFTEEETKKIRAYEQELLLSPIIICDEFQPKIEQVRTKILEYNPDLIIFDHITQVGTHWEHVAQFMRELKVLTMEQKCATLVLSQLNEPGRQKDGTEAVSIRGDVRGSQEILFLSSIFMYISNPYIVKTDVQPVEIHIAKNRYGISGITVSITANKQTGKYGE